jgi:hypothetical protein
LLRLQLHVVRLLRLEMAFTNAAAASNLFL